MRHLPVEIAFFLRMRNESIPASQLYLRYSSNHEYMLKHSGSHNFLPERNQKISMRANFLSYVNTKRMAYSEFFGKKSPKTRFFCGTHENIGGTHRNIPQKISGGTHKNIPWKYPAVGPTFKRNLLVLKRSQGQKVKGKLGAQVSFSINKGPPL